MEDVLTGAKMWKWVKRNRFTVIGPVFGLILFIVAVGCTQTVASPMNPGKALTAIGLKVEFDYMVAQYDLAGQELEAKTKAANEFTEFLLALASGSVATWPGALQLILGSSWLGIFADNVRKNGVIGGLKRNK